LQNTINQTKLVPTGVPGLDFILQGGLPKGRTYLVEGLPGVGKTTLGLQFLLEGVKTGERAMIVSLIETQDELVEVARSHGWDLDGIQIMELPQDIKDSEMMLQTVFPPAEVEFGEIANAIYENIDRYKPDRLLIDSISQLAMLTDTWQQMRTSILKIRGAVHQMGTTTLLTSSKVQSQVTELDTIVHGTISLATVVPAFGKISRKLYVKKMRGHKFVTGRHDYRILTGGIELYTWQEVSHRPEVEKWSVVSSGNQPLDNMLGGGLEEGTACLIQGAAGAGKSTLASLYVQAAAKRGEGAVIFCFDERKDTFLRRSIALNMEIPVYIDQGLVELRQVDAGRISPGEFSYLVARAVESTDARVVVIDSLTGYMNSMPGETNLLRQLHELLSFLGAMGVLSIMVMNKFDSTGLHQTDLDVSYIADTLIVLRHFEALGSIRRSIAVVKKRHGPHEHAIREIKITGSGIELGPPLADFTGILSGNLRYLGSEKRLLNYSDANN